MRFYKTKSIRDIIQVSRENELYELWGNLSDRRLNSIKVTFKIERGKRLSIICPSPTTLSYTRQQRTYLEHALAVFMNNNDIAQLEIRLK